MTMPQMPHLGSTGVIQNPGDLGAIAQGLSGLPAILQATEDAKRRREQEAQSAQYLQAQMQHMAAQEQAQRGAAMGQAAESQAVGNFIGNISTPQPGYGWNPGWQADPMDVGSALQQVDPQYRAAALKEGEPAIKAREAKAAEKQANAKFAQLRKTLDPDTASALATIEALPGTTPADVRTSIYNAKLGLKKKAGIEGYSTLFNAGAITVGDFADASGIQLPPTVDRTFKKPRPVDPITLLTARANVAEDLGQPTEFERKTFLQTKPVVEGIRGMEGKNIAAPSRAELAVMSTKYGTINEFLKASGGPKFKTWLNAASLFLNPVLRSETGAAFGQQEPMMVIERFIPLSDDPPEVLARKAKERRGLALSMMGIGRREAKSQIRDGLYPQADWDADVQFLQSPYTPPPAYLSVPGIKLPPKRQP